MNEEDFRLIKLLKENPIYNCVDLSKNMRGKREGFIYFKETFRVDFENKMSEIWYLRERINELEKVNEELQADNYELNNRINDLLDKGE